MAKSRNQKGKILILEHLLMETGESRIVTMQEILDKLMEYGISAERKSIYDDFDALRDFGMDVKYKRGRPGGYYLANSSDYTSFNKVVEVKNNNVDEGTGILVYEKICAAEIQESAKPMKLLFNEKSEDEIKKFFGDNCEYKSKDSGDFVVSVPQMAGPNFFGWLVSMDGNVRISKPRRIAQAYRDYLKSIVREYKGI